MTTFAIEYSTGGMGHTFLAHILYSCHKINIFPKLLFSEVGDCHKVAELNKTNLIALDQPFDKTKHVTVIHLVPNMAYHLLRLKMSYEKWFKKFPTPDNFPCFGFTLSYEKTEIDFLESLVLKYNKIIENFEGKTDTNIVTLESFLKNNMNSVKNKVEDILGWDWDENRSNEFHQAMVQANKKYLDWFEKINTIYEQSKRLELIATEGLVFWEKAAVIALLCYQLKVPVLELRWHDQRPLLSSDNGFLIEDLKRILENGKTV